MQTLKALQYDQLSTCEQSQLPGELAVMSAGLALHLLPQVLQNDLHLLAGDACTTS